MRTTIIIIALFTSVSAIAQPTVTGSVASSQETTIFLPTNSIILTGTAVQANPGHPILDTTWTKTSGPAATITNSSNRMTTTVTNMVSGDYVFTLTGTDKKNSASSSVIVHVKTGTLPVRLASFQVSQDASGILLTWRTYTESNNSYFIVQKSVDGSNFTDIGIVLSNAENGNSNTPIDYSYRVLGQTVKADMDYLVMVTILLATIGLFNKLNKRYKSLLVGLTCLFLFSCTKSVPVSRNTISSKTEFRLKQVDLDGQITYSAIKVIH